MCANSHQSLKKKLIEHALCLVEISGPLLNSLQAKVINESGKSF